MPKLTTKKTKKVFYPDDDDKAWVEIKYLKKGIRDRIESLSNDISARGTDGEEMETVVAFNLLKKRTLFFDEIIESWGGFIDVKGKETRPTRKNIERFDKELGDLYSWLSEESDIFVEEVEAEEEAEQENLKS